MILTVMLANAIWMYLLWLHPFIWTGGMTRPFLQNTGVTLCFQFPWTRTHKSAEASLYQGWMEIHLSAFLNRPGLFSRNLGYDEPSGMGWDNTVGMVTHHWSKDCSLVRLYPFSSLVMGNLLQIHHRLRFCRLSSTADNQTDRRVARSLQKGIDFK